VEGVLREYIQNGCRGTTVNLLIKPLPPPTQSWLKLVAKKLGRLKLEAQN